MKEKWLQTFKPYRGVIPKITNIARSRNYVYIATDNNWGESYEKVKSMGFYSRRLGS
jgi:hypothetical protein